MQLKSYFANGLFCLDIFFHFFEHLAKKDFDYTISQCFLTFSDLDTPKALLRLTRYPPKLIIQKKLLCGVIIISNNQVIALTIYPNVAITEATV